MAKFTNSNTWGDVDKLELTTPVLGGAESAPSNAPMKQLNDRTFYLKTLVDNIVSGVQGILGKLLNGSTCENTFTSYQQSDTKVPTTAFVQEAITRRTGRRNVIINGNMQVSQRGETFTVTNDSDIFTLDRWLVGFLSGTSVPSITVSHDAVEHKGDLVETAGCMKIVAPSDTGGQITIRQRIVNVATFAGETCQVRFVIHSNSAITIRITLSQFLSSHNMSVDDYEWRDNEDVAITSGLNVVTASFTPGDLSTSDWGDLDAANNLELKIALPIDGAFTGWISNVQLERGTQLSDFEHNDDTLECKRYYELMDINEMVWINRNAFTDYIYGRRNFFPKRTIPTVRVLNMDYSANLEETYDVTDNQTDNYVYKMTMAGLTGVEEQILFTMEGAVEVDSEII